LGHFWGEKPAIPNSKFGGKYQDDQSFFHKTTGGASKDFLIFFLEEFAGNYPL